MFLRTVTISGDALVSDIVKNDYRTADVFQKYGIDYCCGGKFPLRIACDMKGLTDGEIYRDLDKVTRDIQLSGLVDFSNWSIDFLIDYIINIHHSYLHTALPQLENYVSRFAEGHRKKYPELDEVCDTIKKLSGYMAVHLREEEETIFPYIRQIGHAYASNEMYASLLVRTLRKPVEDVMHHEHQMVFNSIAKLRQLTDNYTVPENSCVSHKVSFHKLKEMDNNMAQHVHLENDVLFPRAIAMEKELLRRP